MFMIVLQLDFVLISHPPVGAKAALDSDIDEYLSGIADLDNYETKVQSESSFHFFEHVAGPHLSQYNSMRHVIKCAPFLSPACPNVDGLWQ